MLQKNVSKMNYSENYNRLSKEFIVGKDKMLSETGIIIKYFNFNSERNRSNNSENPLLNDAVPENEYFTYPVFIPADNERNNKAIILLHGLNERSWNKYLTWAEYLCKHTHKAVILFPLAYHINRSPTWWFNPRIISSFIERRKEITGNDRSLSLANIALSERISANPGRFYTSGQQTLNDVTCLIADIYSGKHPVFARETNVDVFAYSIGAFLAQILFMLNPQELMSNSKLFMFCGGSIFNRMYGTSRSIMDKNAFEELYSYYTSDVYITNNINTVQTDTQFTVFKTMIKSDNYATERTGFFQSIKNRFSCVALKQDVVIPYEGIVDALGVNNKNKIDLIDFNYPYNHENPFPIFNNNLKYEVDTAFKKVFSCAAGFLA